MLVSASVAMNAAYICFYTEAGGDTPEAVAANGLVITVEGDNLIATPSSGNALTFPLATLQGMEFSDTPLGIDEILTGGDGKFTVYDLSGVKAGEFTSLDEASATLSHGIYIVKTSTGKTIKLLTGK